MREGGIPRHDKHPRHDTRFWSPDREGGGECPGTTSTLPLAHGRGSVPLPVAERQSQEVGRQGDCLLISDHVYWSAVNGGKGIVKRKPQCLPLMARQRDGRVGARRNCEHRGWGGAAVQVRCRMCVGGMGLAQGERSSSRPWNMKASSAAQDSKYM